VYVCACVCVCVRARAREYALVRAFACVRVYACVYDFVCVCSSLFSYIQDESVENIVKWVCLLRFPTFFWFLS